MVRIFLFILTLSLASAGHGQTREPAMISFLKTCGWGAAIGAGAGAVSLAFEAEPGKHTNNIARGASLGLYVGIAMGLLAMNEPEGRHPSEDSWGVVPQLHEGKLQGAVLTSPVFRF